MKVIKGFTLAEVLITLGVIGVVAAMTLPSVINHYQKQATALKVKKFYNMMNNAINRSIVDNGDVNTWYPTRKNNTYQEDLNFLKTYILPYIKYNRYEIKSNRVFVYLLDGGLVVYRTDFNGTDVDYFINGKYEHNPKNKFRFAFNKKDMKNSTFIEPYSYNWNGDYETLKTSTYESFGCKKNCTANETGCSYCTKILQLNDWKFPDDYPW